ncbi:MAG: prolipoprotein diacylglyceryl transferase family protein [Ginsengibacter sp.]
MLAPHPFLILFGKKIASFTIFGGLGIIISFITTFYLTIFLHLDLLVWLIMTIISIAVLVSLAELMNRIKGTPVLVYYHHEFAIILSITIFLFFTEHHHILQYLDITAAGLGIVLAFGRIGCFMAGCCHGKPSCYGIHYHKEHAEMGFPYYYIETPLFPVQIIEASGVLLIVIVMVFSILNRVQAGIAFAIYILCYGVLRFLLEFARGDISRPYYGPLSEAQWFSVILSTLIIIMAFIGWIPGFAWHLAIIALFSCLLVFLFLIGRSNKPWLKIRHSQIRELAILVNELDYVKSSFLMLRVGKDTILVTAGILKEQNVTVKHFTVSMYPDVEVSWLDCIGNLLYSLQNRSGVLTKLNKSDSMMHFIIKSQSHALVPNVIV